MFFQVLENISIILYTINEGDNVRKNDLFEQNTFLFNRLQMVTAELEKYKKLYDENIREINALRRALAEMETACEAEQSEEGAFYDESTSDFEKTTDVEVFEESATVVSESQSLHTLEDVTLEGASQYAAEVIGKLVLEGAKLSAKFAEKPNEYSKDLINLVLGKTEVCKSAILDICNGDSDDAVKRAQIDVVFTEAVEYFGSLVKQV